MYIGSFVLYFVMLSLFVVLCSAVSCCVVFFLRDQIYIRGTVQIYTKYFVLFCVALCYVLFCCIRLKLSIGGWCSRCVPDHVEIRKRAEKSLCYGVVFFYQISIPAIRLEIYTYAPYIVYHNV